MSTPKVGDTSIQLQHWSIRVNRIRPRLDSALSVDFPWVLWTRWCYSFVHKKAESQQMPTLIKPASTHLCGIFFWGGGCFLEPCQAAGASSYYLFSSWMVFTTLGTPPVCSAWEGLIKKIPHSPPPRGYLSRQFSVKTSPQGPSLSTFSSSASPPPGPLTLEFSAPYFPWEDPKETSVSSGLSLSLQVPCVQPPPPLQRLAKTQLGNGTH